MNEYFGRPAALFGAFFALALLGETPPQAPVIDAPAEVEAGRRDLTASVPPQRGLAYRWALSGPPGSALTGDPTAPLVTFIAGEPGTLTLSCAAVDARGQASAPALSAITVTGPFVAAVRAPAVVTEGRAGLKAAVSAPEGAACHWSISGGGAITSVTTTDFGTSEAEFEAGTSDLVIACTLDGGPEPVPALVKVVPPALPPLVMAPAHGTAQAGGYCASVPPQIGCAWHWTLDHGGVITAGQGSHEILFQAGGAGPLTLTCAVTNAAGDDPALGRATVQVVEAPLEPVLRVASRAAAGTLCTASAMVPPGTECRWTLDGAPRQGTSSLRFPAGKPGRRLLSCRVVNPDGTSSGPGTAEVEVVASGPVIAAPAYATAGRDGCVATVPVPSGSRCQWTLTGTAVMTEGQGTGTLVFTPGRPGELMVGCRITAPGQPALVPEPVQVRVVEAPLITGFAASGERLTRGASVRLLPEYAGGRGVLLPGGQDAPSGLPLTLAPLVDGDYELVVTNLAGDQVRAALALAVAPPPAIDSFTASEHLVEPGTAVTLNAVFEAGPLGTATVDPGVGPVASGQDVTIRPMASGPYTLTVDNGAGATATARILVRVVEKPGD